MIDCEQCKNADEKCLCSIYKVIIPEMVRKSPCKYFEEIQNQTEKDD